MEQIKNTGEKIIGSYRVLESTKTSGDLNTILELNNFADLGIILKTQTNSGDEQKRLLAKNQIKQSKGNITTKLEEYENHIHASIDLYDDENDTFTKAKIGLYLIIADMYFAAGNHELFNENVKQALELCELLHYDNLPKSIEAIIQKSYRIN